MGLEISGRTPDTPDYEPIPFRDGSPPVRLAAGASIRRPTPRAPPRAEPRGAARAPGRAGSAPAGAGAQRPGARGHAEERRPEGPRRLGALAGGDPLRR